ncbi:L-asparaginase II [Anaerosolibacter carboniphilus]|uniref:L-asparaginase II n=1 Tax=Anaerosolibacter carboniphilus TaxID=1417629 RepID=A0A841KUT0_9FIRM|nr:asparaginase [Anaerosolibacter carboniphilus]MBB6217147.1 L-asparaginase II [Anaerosolibacter carboniphilus]
MSVVAKVYRGNVIDLTHIGHVAVVDITGKILYYCGDPYRVTFARSSAKPMQTIPAIESGAVDAYGITDKEIALFCASHSGECFHVEGVRSVLKKAGLNESYLQCGIHMPLAEYAAEALKEKGLKAQTVHCNCSGKHAGMLVTAKHLGEDLDHYYQLEHPVQKRIMNILSEVCQYDEDEIITAIDGCGVPVHAMPLYKFAQGFARLSKPEVLGDVRSQTVTRITEAMIAHPEMVGGTDRICTDLMKLCGDRLFAKAGAGAYYAIGLKGRGIGITFKIEDGGKGIVNGVVLEVLRKLDVISSEEFKKLEKHYVMESKNHKGGIVGETKIAVELIQNN